jgi:hypothetical protein
MLLGEYVASGDYRNASFAAYKQSKAKTRKLTMAHNLHDTLQPLKGGKFYSLPQLGKALA